MTAVAKFLPGDKAWARIREEVRQGPAHVAVAWWCSEMSGRLPLQKGSVLVVRADRETMEQGQTNPSELEKLVKGGVHVFPLKNLHAKIFVFGKAAFVGSMNASRNSWDGLLLEAAVEIGEKSAVRAARKQVVSWARDKPLDLDDIAELKKHYNPRRGGGHRGRGGKKAKAPQRPVMDLPFLKVIRTKRGDWKDHTQEKFDRDSPALETEAARCHEKVEGIEWTGAVPSVDRDTRVLEVGTDEDSSVWLNSPAILRLVTGTKKGKPENRLSVAGIGCETQKAVRCGEDVRTHFAACTSSEKQGEGLQKAG